MGGEWITAGRQVREDQAACTVDPDFDFDFDFDYSNRVLLSIASLTCEVGLISPNKSI